MGSCYPSKCVDQFGGKITYVSKALFNWNELVFGDVKTNIQKLEVRLQCEKDIRARCKLHDLREWQRKEEIMWAMFIPCDVDIILDIPLCHSWPEDKLIWHYTSNDEFSIKSTYYVARSFHDPQHASSSAPQDNSLWKTIWRLDVPPQIRLFGWKVGAQALATKPNLAKRLTPLDMRYEGGSNFDEELWQVRVSAIINVVGRAAKILGMDKLGEFVAMMWERWNSHNRFIFGEREGRRAGLAQRAVMFVHNFRALRQDAWLMFWRPPDPGLLKVNFDARKVADEGRGWGFIIQDHSLGLTNILNSREQNLKKLEHAYSHREGRQLTVL
ncbi:hypothetical protein Cgig2_025667 [Carnegiea gigantea]|uniref:Reverse transcriptase zinc-binding domain-containing protein n=1 Tax=Carnegiea gigantea TaxID=171969 RepID=A0A9Q1Q521_9CARY|nr:hypothetical protein Cgig2_025667 [Carnegiea gigantea]